MSDPLETLLRFLVQRSGLNRNQYIKQLQAKAALNGQAAAPLEELVIAEARMHRQHMRSEESPNERDLAELEWRLADLELAVQ